MLIAPLLGQDSNDEDEEVFELSPFEVTADEREGYQAVDTLAGNRLNTKLRDVGNAISVVTTQFLEDTGATDNQSLLQYTVGTEVGGMEGTFGGVGDGALLDESRTFINPNQNTRIRGLTEADNTRDFFVSDIPWDAYNIDRVELQRGPNSILFGQGSPAGLVNAGLQSASFEDEGQVEVRLDEHSSTRLSVNLNKVLIEDQLAVRVAALYNDTKYQQDPAFRRDERIYTALRWDPAFLNTDSIRTVFKANFENGEIQSNNPRSLTPIDRITPWFQTGTYNGSFVEDGNILDPVNNVRVDVSQGDLRVYNHLNKATFNAHQLQQDNVAFPNHGQGRPKVNGGPFSGAFSPWYEPTLGDFAGNFGGPAVYGEVDGTMGLQWSNEISGARGINSSGAQDGGIGFHFHRPMGIAPTSDIAKNAGLPFGQFGIWKNNAITDTTIFDFYNNLLDGPNKEEWQNFDALNLSFSQTYLNDKIGFDITFNEQNYDNGQLSLMSGSQQAIYIDIMEVYPDGNANTWQQGEIPYDNGTPNPYVGRPFVSDNGNGGNRSYESSRESFRFTPYAKYDLSKGDGNWFTKLIGSGTFTGLMSEDKLSRENRSWNQYSILDQSYIDFVDPAGNTTFQSGFLTPSNVIYIGPSLMGASSASGSNLSRIMAKYDPPVNGTVRAFDSTWKHPLDPSAAGYVDPAALWIRNDNLPPELEYPNYDPSTPDDFPDRREAVQADNPDNYVGWTNVPYTLTRSEDNPAVNRELLATFAGLDHRKTKSEALIWQGHLLENSIVGTYGWRKDTVTASAFNQDTNGDANNANFGHLNFDPSVYRLYTQQEIDDNGADIRRLGIASTSGIEVQSRSYSIVAHLSDLPGLKEPLDGLPFEVSLFYNNSTNFQPESARVDAYGEALAAPAGETIDRGIMVQSKNGRYSFKLNKFKTQVTTATSTALSNAGFLGTSQQYGGNWTNQYEYDFSIDNQSYIWTHMARNRPAGSPVPPNYDESQLLTDRIDTWTDVDGNLADGTPNPEGNRASLYNFGTSGDATTAEAAMAKEQAAIAAWRAWQAQVDPRFYAAWGIDLDAPFRAVDPRGITATQPNGFTVPEDSLSEGYEFEFMLRPTDNWNIMINAAKVQSTRNNIGGAALTEFINGYTNAVNNTAAGDIRIWWGGSGNESTLYQWNKEVSSEWTGRKLQEGTNVPELREWRANVITNYDFTDGRFKGLNIGGGLRYQDSVVIGYRPVINGDGSLGYDLDDPYTGPSETNIDLWVGYGRQLSDKIDWRVQLNVRNAFQGNGLIPITVQPDGTPAGYRIAPSETWSLRNTFSF